MRESLSSEGERYIHDKAAKMGIAWLHSSNGSQAIVSEWYLGLMTFFKLVAVQGVSEV